MDLAVLTRMPEGLEVSMPGQPGSYIGRCVVRRSQVLRNVLEETEEGDECGIPVSVDRLNAWRAFRDKDCSSLDVSTSELINLIMAADVLIDVKCLETVCYELSQRLFPRPGPPVANEVQATSVQSSGADSENVKPNIQAVEAPEGSATAGKPAPDSDCGSTEAIEALQSLPDHLALSVMRAVTHLPALFAALPPGMHPAALRAHHPSIDSHRSLHLTYPPADTLPATMHALSTLGSLTAIALRMRPHGNGNPAGMEPRQFLDLALRLPNLVDVRIEDWRLARPPVAVAAKADVAAAEDPRAGAAGLTRLTLRNSSIPMCALAPRLGTLAALRVLEVEGETRSDATVAQAGMLRADVAALSAHIGQLTALQRLSLKRSKIAPEDWAKLAGAVAALPHLRTVNLSGLQLKADALFGGPGDAESVPVSAMWRRLESIDISWNSVCARSDLVWVALGQMPRLARLSVAGVPTERCVFAHLSDALHAGHAAGSGSGARGDLVDELQSRGQTAAVPAFQLERLDVTNCHAVWGNAFESCMRAWPGLQQLVAAGLGRLQRMAAPNAGLTAGRAPQVAKGLMHVPALRELVLSDHKGLGPEGVRALAPALGGLSALTLLDLSACGVTAQAAEALCPEVARLLQLEVLRLAKNAMASDGVGRLLAAVVACERLKDVDLSWNSVGDGIAVALKAQLHRLCAMERLDLRHNNFRESKATLRALSMKRGNVLVV